MAKSKKAHEEGGAKNDPRLEKSKENLRIEKEKSYQRKVKGPQVENQTTLKDKKKAPLPKPKAKKK